MPVSLTTLTGPIYMPNGATPIGGRVSFELSSWDREEGEALVVSGPTYSNIDENGQFSVELFTTTEGVNTVNYRMYVLWEDSTLSQSYVNDVYVSSPVPHYTKKYIGSFALSGLGPFSVSDLNIMSELELNSFDVLLECQAYALAAKVNVEEVSTTLNVLVDDANNAADLSQAWAEGATAPGGPGSKSAKTWAVKAQGSASEAATDAAAAANSVAESPKLQRLSCELDVGNYLNGVDTEYFFNAQRPFQDFDFVDNAGATQLLMVMAAEGDVYATNERARIVLFDYADDGSTLTETGFTALLNIGHTQGFTARKVGATQYIYTTAKTLTADNPGKGVSKIAWQGAATTDADISQIVLFGDKGSSHIFANLYRAMPTVSADGKYLIIHAELEGKSDDNGMVLFYDLAAVEAAADAKTVMPLRYWRTQNPPWLNGWVKQGLVWKDQELLIVYSGSHVEDAKFIEAYSFNGTLKRRDLISGALDLYGEDGILDNATLGPCVQAEVEGLAVLNGRLFFGFCTAFMTSAQIVTANVGGHIINLVATQDVPIGIEAWDQAYWSRTLRPATAGAHDKAKAYTRGYTKTEKAKRIFEYGPIDARTDWLPISPDFYGLSGNERQSSGNGLDYAVPIGQAIGRGWHSSLDGGDGIPLIGFTDLPGETRIMDMRSNSTDTVRFGQITKVSNATQKYTRIQTYGGATLTLWDADSPTNAGQVQRVANDGVKQGVFSDRPDGLTGVKGAVVTPILVANGGVASFDAVGKSGILQIFNGQGAADTNIHAKIYYKAVATTACIKIDGGSLVDVTTGILIAGGGTAGKITVSVHSDGKIYITNNLADGYARWIAAFNIASVLA